MAITTLLEESFENGANGATPVPGSTSPTVAFDAQSFSVVVPTFATSAAMHDTLGLKLAGNASSGQGYYQETVTSYDRGLQRFYFKKSATPGATVVVSQMRNAGGGVADVRLTTGDILRFYNSAGSAITTGTMTTALANDTWYRVEVAIVPGADTTTGAGSIRLYLGDSASLLDSQTVTGQNFRGGDITIHRIGRASSSIYTGDASYDDVALAGGIAASTEWIGPKANVVPTISVTGNQNVSAAATVNIAATAADSDGSIASYAWTFDFPASGTPSLTGGSTANVSFTAGSAPQLYILRCTVTDNSGATAYATTEVRVPATGSATSRPLSGNGTGVGTWTNTGGAANEGVALNDESDSTYLETGAVSGTEQTRRWRFSPTASRSSGNFKLKLAADTGTVNWNVRLYEGATSRQTWTQATSTSTPTDYTFTFSGGTISAISDWGNLYLEVGATS